MDDSKLVNVTFVLHNGIRIDMYGYKLSDARAIAHRFNTSKNNPKESCVMTYESTEEPSKGLTVDLKNVLAVFYQ